MFDVGFSEVLMIMVIALIVVGPERLPKIARTVGLWVGKARRIVGSVKSEVERELRVAELKQSIKDQAPVEEFNQLKQEMQSLNSDVKSAGSDLQSAAADFNKPAAADTDSSSHSHTASSGTTPATPASTSASSSPSPPASSLTDSSRDARSQR